MTTRAVLLKTLKCGKKIWEEGTVFEPPFPPEIEIEIFNQTGIVQYEGDLEESRVSSENGTTSTSSYKTRTHPDAAIGREIKPRRVRVKL